MSKDMIWQYCQRKTWKRDTKINLFLFLHTIIWAIAGICLWSLVSIFILRDIGWMLTFVGYAAFFPGFIGGIMFLWSHDTKYEYLPKQRRRGLMFTQRRKIE